MEFQDVYDAHFSFVWRISRRMGLSEADAADACQEVFLVVHRRLPDFDPRAKVSTWLYRIASRIVRDIRQRAHRRYELSDRAPDERLADAPSPSERTEMKRDISRLDLALRELRDEQREVFILYELEEMTTREVAACLEIPLGTVHSRLRLARQRFRRTLARQQAQRDGSASLKEKSA